MADVTLPQLGETVTEGTITQWFKQVGDTVAADEALFEVSTDKVDTEVPSPIAGTLTEIRVAEGETVEVGTVIAVVGDADAAPADDAAPAETGQEAAPAETGDDAAPAETGDDAAPAETGDDAAPADESAPESADAPAAGDEAPPADAPVEATDPGASPSAQPSGATEAPEESDAEGSEARAAEPREAAGDGDGDGARPAAEPAPRPSEGGDASQRLLSPVVRRLVTEHGLDPAAISGSGPGGRITRDDVLDHIDRTGSKAAPPAEPAPAEPAAAAAPAQAAPTPTRAAAPKPAAPAAPAVSGERDRSVPLSKIRQLTGAHMVMSKSVSPHAFSVVEVDYANVDSTRLAIKDAWKRDEGFSLTYLPFISRATIDALAEFPHLNASVGENELVVHGFVDLGIAVDLDYEGLIVPVVREADSKRLRALAREISDLAERAKTKKLKPDEITGGTFTISNNGSAGSVLTMAIINQPQVAVLSTDAITRKPVVVGAADGGEAIAIHPVGNLAMSWDHRAFDGAYAARFLKKVKELLETKDWSAEL